MQDAVGGVVGLPEDVELSRKEAGCGGGGRVIDVVDFSARGPRGVIGGVVVGSEVNGIGWIVSLPEKIDLVATQTGGKRVRGQIN